jgi:uroporphyrinogen-III decarboxylase
MLDELLFDLPYLTDRDFAGHNAEASALWAAFDQNRHARVPMRFNTNPRMLMLDPRYNRRGVTYKDYFTDPDLMARVALEWQY